MEKEFSKRARVLVVDDDKGARESIEAVLEDDYKVVCAHEGPLALEMMGKQTFDLVLLDLIMPKMDGIETLNRIKEIDKSIDVIMVSATDRAREATAALKSGAYDYITKPFEPESILTAVERALEKRALEREVRYLRSEVALQIDSHRIVSQAKSMKSVFALIEKVARTPSNVLITGESGTGKELVARAIHNRSLRAQKPFVAINCAAIPSELIESELFGHEKGSFTGAYNRGVGKFEYANDGTVFLDEISSLKLELQAKLLRFLQEREFTRVGSHRAISVDVRMIAATNTRLSDLVHKDRFREDLYFRLNVIPIELPPLRHREGDIPLLTRHFIDHFNRQLKARIKGISPEALEVLEGYSWPGNIRELENLVERMVVLKTDGDMIEENDLPLELMFQTEMKKGKRVEKGLFQARQAFERQYILRALQSCQWNQSKASALLKVHRNTLLQKVKALGIKIRNDH